MSRATSRALILAVSAFTAGLGLIACSGEPTSPDKAGTVQAAAPDLSQDGVPDKKKCSFSKNVLEMFDASTNATALPSTKIGTGCTDDRKFSAYKSLF